MSREVHERRLKAATREVVFTNADACKSRRRTTGAGCEDRGSHTGRPAYDRGPIAVSPAEAARLAGISRSSLYKLLSSGDLPSFKLGKRRLIRVDDLDALLSANAATLQGPTSDTDATQSADRTVPNVSRMG